jgi:hypothetical protein
VYEFARAASPSLEDRYAFPRQRRNRATVLELVVTGGKRLVLVVGSGRLQAPVGRRIQRGVTRNNRLVAVAGSIPLVVEVRRIELAHSRCMVQVVSEQRRMTFLI